MCVRYVAILFLFAISVNAASAGEMTDIDALRKELSEIRQAYEARIHSLEDRIKLLEESPRENTVSVNTAIPETPVVQDKPNDFNPSIGVVLVGTAASFSRGGNFAVPGFMVGNEAGPGDEGFSAGESEINAKANIDDKFFGNFTLAVADVDGSTEVELEEAWFETLALPQGLKLRGGRFFSGIGYRNQFHRHADDFVDRSLPYRVFLNGQYLDDGVQLSWLAPTDTFVELGAEWLRGAKFPAGGSGSDGKGVWSLFAHVGGDVGASHSWKAGVSWLSARAKNRDSGSGDVFNGNVDLAMVDGVWKWAPNGNPYRNNLKLEGALFWQDQDGVFMPNAGGALAYDEDQWGGYLEGIYQFMPRWRAGMRYAWVDTDNPGAAFNSTSLDTLGVSPKIYSAMLDWSNSEFSRLRLQYSRDDSDVKPADRFYLQYIMSLGAHGAHQF